MDEYNNFKHILGDKMKNLLFIFALGLVLIANPAMAEKRDVFKKLDADGDSKVSESEFTSARAKRAQEIFKKVDVNNDGYIDEEEWTKAKEMLKKRRQK